MGAMGGGRVWMLCMCIAAIYAAYLTQGIVQENVLSCLAHSGHLKNQNYDFVLFGRVQSSQEK